MPDNIITHYYCIVNAIRCRKVITQCITVTRCSQFSIIWSSHHINEQFQLNISESAKVI